MNFEDKKICSECGGKCCKRMPGNYHPDDFDRDQKKMLAAIKNGVACIDWWEGLPDEKFTGVCEYPENEFCGEEARRIRWGRGPYLRAPVKGKEHRLRDPTWGGPCALLTENGCCLPHNVRPHECRMLEPTSGYEECKFHGKGRRELAILWKPWWDWLDSVQL